MNTKTTLYLAVALTLLACLYFFLESRPGPAEAESLADRAASPSKAAVKLLEEPLGDIVKVVCRRKEGEEWVFEKKTGSSETAGQTTWRMTKPRDMKCTSWEVDKFGRQIGNLQYELSYKPGEPGAITAADAGLEPPAATVTLTDAEKQTVTVEIGKPASARETYVRLQGKDEICVGKSDLTNLLKDKPLDYRDKQLWSFEPGDVTRVDIVDRTASEKPTPYAFVKDGARWMMESPVTARATSKVDDMLAAMGRLRVIQWVADDPAKLPVYGLDKAARTVRVTVEEEVKPEEPEEKNEEQSSEEPEASEPAKQTPEPKKKTTVYELYLSDRSPIGEETKTYLRIGEESAVATVWKSSAEKFKPVMAQWREMHVTTENVEAAARIELTTRDGSATLVKKEGHWSFDADAGRAEDAAVSTLLKKIAALTAVTFIDNAPEDPSAYGLDAPQAELRLTVPGVEHVERITVGGYTDAKAKRLVYVRRNELASIAKVRAADAAPLVQGPHAYRDRTIVDVLPSRFERIALSRQDGFGGGRVKVTLDRHDNIWSMAEPAAASVQQDQVDKLIEALGGLRAEQVVAEEAEPSAYGLHAPAVTIDLTYKPPVEYRLEETTTEKTAEDTEEAKGGPEEASADAEAAGEAPGEPKTKTTPVEYQPPSKTIELLVTEHDGKHYAKRSDRPTLYEVNDSFYRQLLAEYRTDRVINFDAAHVRRFSIRKGDEQHAFEKKDDRWVYAAEPDLPLDSKKVDNLLLQIRDLRTPRYVRHEATDLTPYGLSAPFREVIVSLDDDTDRVLWVSNEQGDNGTDKGFYAAVKDRDGVFLLTADSVGRFKVSLDELE